MCRLTFVWVNKTKFGSLLRNIEAKLQTVPSILRQTLVEDGYVNSAYALLSNKSSHLDHKLALYTKISVSI